MNKTPIQETIESMLALDESEHERLSALLKSLRSQLQTAQPVAHRSPQLILKTIEMTWHFTVPWLALMDTRETWSTQQGIFVYLLVRNDRSGIYLTLSRGETDRSAVRRQAPYQRAKQLDIHSFRSQIDFLSASGFLLNSDVDLRTDHVSSLFRFQKSTIAHKAYERGSVPNDTELLNDLELVLTAYDHYLTNNVGIEAGKNVHMTEPLVSIHLAGVTSMLREGALEYTEDQIASFLTGLQTKGFVILSGISGTGKTKLIQQFATLLPATHTLLTSIGADVTVTVKPYMLKYGTFTVPKRSFHMLGIVPDGSRRELAVVFDGETDTARLSPYLGDGSSYLELALRGTLRKSFMDGFQVGDKFGLEPELDDQGILSQLTITRFNDGYGSTSAQELSSIPVSNLLFLPVRPDWRDSKSLLGYYNPLTDAYEWTTFLRFLEQASQNYRSDDPVAWFVALDEMNLTHVEYYFADLLSVLESGRDEDGWTREAINLAYPDTLEIVGDLPPHEMKLPPNVYVVGTVNIDETTHAFSPKVLDRAFSIELVDVDFSDYPPATIGEPFDLTDEQRRELLQAFTRNGRFHGIDKGDIAAYVAANPHVRDRLQRLNTVLRPYTLHFGYRVFDEIVTFLVCAGENGMFDDLGGQAAAFDAAVLMKVLPKFHGSRGKLESPLVAVLDWCADPEASGPTVVDIPITEFMLPKTAARVQRMLHELRTEGFTAFG